jgi:hypothetical protein
MTIVRASALARGLLHGIVVVVGLVAGCSGIDSAQSEQPGRAKVEIPAPSVTGVAACFYPRQAQDFRVLDRSNLIVYAPNDRNAYHVQVSPPSHDLRYADSLAFIPSNDRICGYAGERLIIGGSTAGQPAAIIAVSRLSPESLESLRAGSVGAVPPAVEPMPGPGAAIERAPESAPDPATKADSAVEK